MSIEYSVSTVEQNPTQDVSNGLHINFILLMLKSLRLRTSGNQYRILSTQFWHASIYFKIRNQLLLENNLLLLMITFIVI